MTVRRENLVGPIYVFIYSFIHLSYFATGIYGNETEK